MNCKLARVSGELVACTNIECGRTLKVRAGKSLNNVELPCHGTAPGDNIPEAAVELAKLLDTKVHIGDEPHGPGTEFRKMVDDRGVTQRGCGCASTEARMNQLGADGCRREIDSLIPEVIANAAKKGVELCGDAARVLILEACRRAELLSNEVLHDSNLTDLPSTRLEDADLDLNSP